jgi:hypothetical protein
MPPDPNPPIPSGTSLEKINICFERSLLSIERLEISWLRGVVKLSELSMRRRLASIAVLAEESPLPESLEARIITELIEQRLARLRGEL